MKAFIRDARASRGFPLKESATGRELLTNLNLLDNAQPTHAAILLFGKEPQRFLPTSEIKCAHFHGTEVAKPIPSYQVYKGTVFTLVDQAVDFVMSKLALSVGTRAESAQAPVAYEIPREVVSEAIVNAVAHRDYTSNGSVQVMLFADRLEVWNPGNLPSTLTLERLREPHGSVPQNPLLAEPMYLTKYIERMGTGTGDMIRLCREAGLTEPEFRVSDGFTLILWRPKAIEKQPLTGTEVGRPAKPTQSATQLTDPVDRLLVVLSDGALSPSDSMAHVGLKHRPTFRENYLYPALEQGLIEMTLPDVPSSRNQKYRLTTKGKERLEHVVNKRQES